MYFLAPGYGKEVKYYSFVCYSTIFAISENFLALDGNRTSIIILFAALVRMIMKLIISIIILFAALVRMITLGFGA